MSYQINKYDNSLLTTVEDGTIDQTTDIKFVGRNYAGYGEVQNENFLFLLENFSGANSPPRAVTGQMWFDSAARKLKFYDGTKFRSTGGAEISTTEPSGLTVGDFWWDTGNDQLYVYNGAGYVLIGPQGAGAGVTQMQSLTVRDTTSVNHSVIASVINDEVITVISPDEFTIDPGDPSAIEGFDVIKKGITLKNTRAATSGVTSTDHRFWGTASNTLRLGGFLAADYVRTSSSSFANVVSFADAGLTIGDSSDISILVENGNEGVIANTVGSSNVIKLKANNSGGTLTHSMSITATGLNPSTNSTYNLGTSGAKWATVHADAFNGVATQADSLKVGANYRTSDVSATNNTVAIRDTSGGLAATIFNGVATSARYADLAEKYTTPGELTPGTVVEVCSHEDHEVGQSTGYNVPVGVVSTNPAFMMNSEADGQYIALVGRVPVRIRGAVTKGQTIYSSSGGVATSEAGTYVIGSYIVGIALETNSNSNEKLVECILKV